MKKVLSLLVVFVFLQVQTWALSGGPFQNTGSSNSVVGTYAGVMVGTVPAGGVPNAGGAGLGLFTIGLPEGGIGTGVFALFSGGFTIIGDVIGLGDPNERRIVGVMQGEFVPASNVGGTFFYESVGMGAQFDVKIEGSNRTASAAGSRISGTAGATITYFGFGTVQVSADFVVSGYKQSSDPTAATSTTLPSSGTP